MAVLGYDDIVLKNKIAQRIEQLRINTGLSPIQFANQHNIDRQIIHRWESQKNKRGVTIYTVAKFCQMIDISLNEFFNDRIFNE